MTHKKNLCHSYIKWDCLEFTDKMDLTIQNENIQERKTASRNFLNYFLNIVCLTRNACKTNR